MKKKVLHTRVPEELFDEIVTRAKKSRTTVSSLVRNLVEDFLEISEHLSDFTAEKARDALFESEERGFSGYQSFTLLKDSSCTLCATVLKKGSPAELAFREGSARGQIVCANCLETNPRQKTKTSSHRT